MSDLVPNNFNNPIVSSKDALVAIIAAQGNLALAADISGVKEELLVAALVSDENNLSKLNSVLRTFSVLKLFKTMDSLQNHVMEELAEGRIKGRDITKAYTDIATLLESLTDTHTQTNINVFETAMRTLPPHVQTALQVLAGGKSTSPQQDEVA